MSFILDALKKSENERQQQKPAEFAIVPGGRDSGGTPRWLWAFGLLLVINLVVVAGLMLRSDDTPVADTPALSTDNAQSMSTPPSLPDTEESFADRIEDARRKQPAESAAPPASHPQTPAAATPERAGAPPRSRANTPLGMATLPSLQELQVRGVVDLPELHIDLHVYNDAPASRFVSINMHKYRENEQLEEGPRVREITPEGVILEYQGKAFALLQ